MPKFKPPQLGPWVTVDNNPPPPVFHDTPYIVLRRHPELPSYIFSGPWDGMWYSRNMIEGKDPWLFPDQGHYTFPTASVENELVARPARPRHPQTGVEYPMYEWQPEEPSIDVPLLVGSDWPLTYKPGWQKLGEVWWVEMGHRYAVLVNGSTLTWELCVQARKRWDAQHATFNAKGMNVVPAGAPGSPPIQFDEARRLTEMQAYALMKWFNAVAPDGYRAEMAKETD
jgi:hypothetical protein